ncbi:DUF3853 family protein [Dysgonomonas sp. Marseille-P4677]|uniref:DUF3853 family protein n=1 Tax=Dysgonomonas sp. Marseille-P4677 TaxID=2364790 RepID=UPI001912A9E1|nr:DUF3853 family protein [Dysgonomonas sp. Marseille-P4677]MBK5722630.1 DUF3853 family protein [Dysgonomonas sp. Marseille-P4677]
MNQEVDFNTPVAMLTVGQLVEVLSDKLPTKVIETQKEERKYVYGIAGIARLFNCSIPTANRIKASGKISGAIRQIGRKIVVDADLALELAGRKNGGRR